MRHLPFAIAIIAAASSSSSCVPSTEEQNPRGAIVVETVPSAASRGEAFVTADGWTVHVDVLLLQVYIMGISADPAKREAGDVFGIPSGDVLISASQPAELLSYGVPTGLANADVVFTFHSISRGDAVNNRHNVDPALVARFKKEPDVIFAFELPPGVPQSTQTIKNTTGPSFLVIARGEKDGRVVKMDIALQDEFGLGHPRQEPAALVRANDLVRVRVPLTAENLFVKDLDEGSTLLFGDFAAADANGDGILTAAELDGAREAKPCTGFCTPEEDLNGSTMAKAIAKRVTQVFVQEP